ncbi:hypothetical protein ER308_08300 [Egibacter rhizosphaerae]|uniref:Phosphate ABC transporter substrate-binding protein n=1 Tax=Egibacter rhizosphaerae TaxID=1670831 RepID=A0A411YED4_9ACTN|nr:PhnD/SsuA/transferrin family substrate-binding protein [Egibacter rhizosphaerae]QBI19550.1 hypothetical protein ER308_08300 [Egibacter rhizosphaerae]
MHRPGAPLRMVSYLVPAGPVWLFERLASVVARTLDRPVELHFDASRSGPGPDGVPFTSYGADIGFVCAPSYRWLRHGAVPVSLVGVAPVPSDPRSAGVARHVSEVVVRPEHPAGSVEDLADATWAANDPCSQSGYHAITEFLPRARTVFSGSHERSMAMVEAGEADAAAIDAQVRRGAHDGLRPRDGLRCVGVLGPHPTQPMVAGPALTAAERDALAVAMLALRGGSALTDAGLAGFGRVADETYAGVRTVRPALEAP